MVWYRTSAQNNGKKTKSLGHRYIEVTQIEYIVYGGRESRCHILAGLNKQTGLETENVALLQN
jgi:hypothetical protein